MTLNNGSGLGGENKSSDFDSLLDGKDDGEEILTSLEKNEPLQNYVSSGRYHRYNKEA